MALRLKLIFSLMVLALASGLAAGQSIVSGEYEDLVIGVSKDEGLTGYFSQGTGDDGRGNPRFTCTFLIKGNSDDGGRYEIKTWHPAFPEDVVAGEMTLSQAEGRTAVTLRLFGEHGGCWNVAPMLKEDEGVEFELTKRGDWDTIRMISASRSYFHASADAKSRGRSYVVKNDPVRVLRASGDFVEAIFVASGGKTSQGWLPAKDLYPMEP
jgi:hypothetical protein